MTRRRPSSLTLIYRSFEAQLTAVKERLEAAKIGSAATRNLTSPGALANHPSANAGPFGSRIAKPLRGGGGAGGGAGGEGPIVPTFAGLQARANANAYLSAGAGAGAGVPGGNGVEGEGKRGSWFFNQRT